MAASFDRTGGGAAIGLLLGEPATQHRPHIDIASVIAVSAGLFALVFSLSRAGTAGWPGTVTLGALAAGVVLTTSISSCPRRWSSARAWGDMVRLAIPTGMSFDDFRQAIVALDRPISRSTDTQ